VPTGEEFRAVALSLPETEERETWGRPTFRVRNRVFAVLGADPSSGTVKATKAAQAALVGSDPAIFSVPPYFGVHGWVAIDLAAVDPTELRELVTEAWAMTAPRRLVRDHEG
jgi:hypothetical protein